ncbi:MAG TPA: type II toxin-antitoxin system VapC family toxin [Rhizomicrobium sp.]|nr:type II toxin-antitoxin system VapC family toxin [Rhizomicrobium sp.]
MIILDTNVISEAMQPRPAESVARWLRFAPGEELYTTAVTEAEMRYGAASAPVLRRRKDLSDIVDRIFTVRFAGRVLPFDSHAAKFFPQVLMGMSVHGRTHSHSDAQIAAIALSVDASIATRDMLGFEYSGVELINPWEI